MKTAKKHAIVTGATSGMGWAIAKALAERGDIVGVLGRRQELAEKLVHEIRSSGGEAIVLASDVGDPAELRNSIELFVSETGRLDTVVASAGIFSSKSVLDATLEEWNEIMSINLSGMFYTAKFTMPHLVLSQGNFIAISSSSGLRGAAASQIYAASKHGVNGLMKSLALDYSKTGVRVNVICPGAVQTPMAERGLQGASEAALNAMKRGIPVGRFGEAEEIAEAVLYLASDKARYVNGAELCIDGGITAGCLVTPPTEAE